MTEFELPSPTTQRDVELTSEPVELYKVLKFEALVNSGGEAKMVIDEGLIFVNGSQELRRRRKIRRGDVIVFDDIQLNIMFSGDD